MRISTYGHVLVVFLAFGLTNLQAQGKIEWDTGYPKEGTETNTILIKGTVKPDANWTVKAGVFPVWLTPVGSGIKIASTVTIEANGTFNGVIAGLTGDTSYWVIIEGDVESGKTLKTLWSDPKTAKAKKGST